MTRHRSQDFIAGPVGGWRGEGRWPCSGHTQPMILAVSQAALGERQGCLATVAQFLGRQGGGSQDREPGEGSVLRLIERPILKNNNSYSIFINLNT